MGGYSFLTTHLFTMCCTIVVYVIETKDIYIPLATMAACSLAVRIDIHSGELR